MRFCAALSIRCCVQVATSGKLEDQEVGDMVNGIDPLWVLVDRVISQQEKKGERDWHSTTFNCMSCTLHEPDMWRALLQLASTACETAVAFLLVINALPLDDQQHAARCHTASCCNTAACCAEHALCTV